MSLVGTNRIMADRKADPLHNSRNSQPVINFSRKSSGLVCNNLYPVTEFDNESSALPHQQPSNKSQLTAFKRRSYAVNALYKNVMHKRNSTGILSIEHNKPPDNGDSKSNSSSKPNARPTSMISATSSINLILNNDSQSQKIRNPINHYEQNMNFALRPKSSSTVDLLTSHHPKVPERSYSAHTLRKVIASNTDNNDFNKSVVGKENENRNESDSECEDDNTEDDLLCDEIADALRDDLFHKEVTFDNKWAEATGPVGSMEDHHSTTSSNQSPLTKTLKSGLRNGLSRRDSIILEDFEKDLTAVSSPTRRFSGETCPKTGSRLQLKLDTLKLKFESIHHDFEGPLGDSLTAISNSTDSQLQSHNKSPAELNFKYWATNIDVKTKIVSDKISRELKAVRRCVVDDNNVNGKVVASKVNRILSQNHSQGRKFAPLREVKHLAKGPPLVKTVNSTHSDEVFSKFFENTKKERNDDDMFQEKALQVINDENLRDSILHGRDYSSRIWLEYERLEFN